MVDTSIDAIDLHLGKGETSNYVDLNHYNLNNINDFNNWMGSPEEQEEAVAESGQTYNSTLILEVDRTDASGSGASSINPIVNKSSWFHIHNVHGNGTTEKWLDRVQKGMFENGAGSITQAYQKGYFSDAPVQNAAKSLITEGAITQAQWDGALARSATGNPSAEDKYVLGMVGLRHAASFGGDKNALNWNEDVLKEGTYLSYLDGKGISREFAHGTLNNFKSGISAVQTGGDALTVESGEWKLNTYRDWSATWGEYINNNAAPATYIPIPTGSGGGGIPFHPGTGNGLPPPINLPNFPTGPIGGGSGGGGGVNGGGKPQLPGIKDPTDPGNTPNPGTGGNYQGGGEVQNLQAYRKRDGSNGYASNFVSRNVSALANGGMNLRLQGGSGAEIVSPNVVNPGTRIISTMKLDGVIGNPQTAFLYGNNHGQGGETGEIDIIETAMNRDVIGRNPDAKYIVSSGYWKNGVKLEDYKWDIRDFGKQWGETFQFVTDIKDGSVRISLVTNTGELKTVKEFFNKDALSAGWIDKVNMQTMYNTWWQDWAPNKGAEVNYQVLGETRQAI